ncbi:hypothetical protein N781_08615 [Pontibacillus halophilus JSM 076056 = DSM 19796]|uniref:GIY-YIG domain-containing protein n=1 Tax=Pontibacillus halophilus JSM 076056 = DSM 19796 TaxID=1385510 RepID=A0A0A5GFV8_9BACI|nr:GIY-YIG nuclease family protein [Pontibacillus halophilus]KGX90098.1 hypothetical protein N781_08615 [Pontibacillus halophilus JSM 076056 = DSM 19796]
MENKHTVYMLSCSDGTIYTGYTNDLTRRVQMHNEGKGAKYTRGRGPVQAVYVSHFDHKGDALREEHRIKRLTKQQKLALIAVYKEGLNS